MTCEEALTGGRTTPGIVRKGDTVRRPSGHNSKFVRGLLAHLAANGFREAPHHLGHDAHEREVLSYIEGAVPAELTFFDGVVLGAAARLIRKYHDATVGFASDAEVICHNDLSPCNFVFVDGLPTALIDFDAAAGGTRLRDLAYASWLWLDIGNDEITPEQQLPRLDMFVRAYDDRISIGDVVAEMLRRQEALAGEVDNPELSAWAAECLIWTRDRFVAAASGTDAGER